MLFSLAFLLNLGLYRASAYPLLWKILAAQPEQNLTQNVAGGGIMGTDYEFSDDPLVDDEEGQSTELV